MDIISIGEMLIDFLPGEEPGSYVQNFGGAPANLAVAAARNGLKAGFCGKVGDDYFGRFLQDTLKENGVEVLSPERAIEATTTMAFVSLAEDGERTFTFARKPGADMLLTNYDIPVAALETAAVVHAGSVSLSQPPASDATVYGLKTAQQMEKIVSFDVNYRDMLWDHNRDKAIRTVGEILKYVDWLKVSDEEMDFLEEGNILAAMKKHEITLVMVTLGAKGARCYYEGRIIDVEGIATRAVDTTGAGDAFWGGFISSLIHQGVRSNAHLTRTKIEHAMRYGNVSGHLCVQEKGAIASLPDRAAIEAHLQRIYG